MRKPEGEIRAEIKRQRAIVQATRHKRNGSMEALAAEIIIQALTWTLGELPSPMARVKP